ncbi:MAG: hypothetical protein Q4A46_08460, partial [Clostridia bacterium]|nr:hypothetical protein [Clostridia bacterium]
LMILAISGTNIIIMKIATKKIIKILKNLNTLFLTFENTRKIHIQKSGIRNIVLLPVSIIATRKITAISISDFVNLPFEKYFANEIPRPTFIIYAASLISRASPEYEPKEISRVIALATSGEREGFTINQKYVFIQSLISALSKIETAITVQKTYITVIIFDMIDLGISRNNRVKAER